MAGGNAQIDVKLLRGPAGVEPLKPFPPSCGAECVFLGRTRREVHSERGELASLFYEAYEPMAVRVLQDLAQQAVDRFGCRAVRIHHALGEVPIGSASVLVQVAAGHRDAAFEACRFLIDQLKTAAPIWKREQWTGGSTWSPGHVPAATETTPCAAG